MCELFAMSSSHPATVNLSLGEFSRHGGLTADHSDGWGLAYVEDRDVRVFRDIDPAADSPYLQFVSKRQFRSDIVISHIRRATLGDVALRNTHPFARELGGRVHLFAHNGDIPGIKDVVQRGSQRFRPIGETDSEMAFCLLLHRLQPMWLGSHHIPSLEDRLKVILGFSRDLRLLGPANFIYTDGDVIFLHGHQRKHHEDGRIRPPGLHLLCRSCQAEPASIRSRGLTIDVTTKHVVLAASVPLTDEPWMQLDEGEVVVLRDGEIVRRILPKRS
ncbi:MAG: class II glutamine amidotransferase [Acidobacteria bacterium]|nr:class II glutamine amidotransferase [Acidobacteriota bacterium]